jgi:hypothetical protein
MTLCAVSSNNLRVEIRTKGAPSASVVPYFKAIAQLPAVNANQVIESVTGTPVTIDQHLEIRKEGLQGTPGKEMLVFDQEKQFFPEVALVSTQAQREYLKVLWLRYRKVGRRDRTLILDEICRNLGLHRKSAVRLMGRAYSPRIFQGLKGGRRRKYSAKAKEHLTRLWRLMGYMGPVRMKAALPIWIEFDETPDCSTEIRGELLRMSESTIRRLLADDRAQLRRRMNTGTYRGVRRFVTKVPVRDLGKTPEQVGHCEIDCVAHCGSSMSGQFAWTLNFTDIVTGWTECEAVWAKTSDGIKRALIQIEKRLPFKLVALYADNGSEFLNEKVIDEFCVKGRSERLPLYRGRPYRKNDQCYVEQKNYTHVRQIFGYGRIDWRKAVGMMNAIYRKEWRELQNYYSPQQKLEEKIRIGARIKRRMSKPATPWERLRATLSAHRIEELESRSRDRNPFRIRQSQLKKVRLLLGYFKEQIPKNEWGKMAI